MPLDDKIHFTEEGHQYLLDHTLLATKLDNKNNYGTIPPLVSATKILHHYFPSTFDKKAHDILYSEEHQEKLKIKDLSKDEYKYAGCFTVDAIKACWGAGAALGTEMHNHFELMANLIEMDRDKVDGIKNRYKTYCESVDPSFKKEIEMFHHFCEEFDIFSGRRVFFRTEIRCFNETLLITGSVDGLLYDTERKTYIIIDYKRLKRPLTGGPKTKFRKTIQELGPNSRGIILPSMMETRNDQFSYYGCQLTLYKHLLKMLYQDMKFSSLHLVVFCMYENKFPELDVVNVPVTKFDQNIYELLLARADEIYDYIEHDPDVNKLYKDFVFIYTSQFNQSS